MDETVNSGSINGGPIGASTSLAAGGQSDAHAAPTPPLKSPSKSKNRIFATGGVIGALAASSCCILPLVLFSLGIGGAWIGNLTALYPYKPIFVTITVLFLAGGFYSVYRKPKTACEAGSYCASPTSGRVLKIVLWGSMALVVIALFFPYLVPYLMQ